MAKEDWEQYAHVARFDTPPTSRMDAAYREGLYYGQFGELEPDLSGLEPNIRAEWERGYQHGIQSFVNHIPKQLREQWRRERKAERQQRKTGN